MLVLKCKCNIEAEGIEQDNNKKCQNEFKICVATPCGHKGAERINKPTTKLHTGQENQLMQLDRAYDKLIEYTKSIQDVNGQKKLFTILTYKQVLTD